MQTMDQNLEKLLEQKIITKEHAREFAANKDKFS
jgi:Tfp pilus assembly pilus retraction ATPase PilT